jgi:hypothetical protein
MPQNVPDLHMRGFLVVQAFRDNGRLAVDDPSLAQSIWDSGLGCLLVKSNLQVMMLLKRRTWGCACIMYAMPCQTGP